MDTSAFVHLRRGHREVARRLGRAPRLILPSVVIGELEALYRGGTRLAENLRFLEEFLDERFVVVARIGPLTARHYGVTVAALRRAGTPIPTNDVWIAATALEHGARVVTFDGDFERVEGLWVTRLVPDGR